MSERREAQIEQNKIENRLDEISDLLARFELLADHYNTDLLRLEAIRDSGTLFAYLQQGPCPLCGTLPSEQKHTDSCDGDVAAIVASADAEARKINTLQEELARTRRDLVYESADLQKQKTALAGRIAILTKRIDELLAPALSHTQISFRELADARANVSRQIELYVRLDDLKLQREEFIAEEQPDGRKSGTTTDLSKSVLDDFAKSVEDILKDWHFPFDGQVYFDESTRDFVIGGKPRGSYGKGFRAITHAAVAIGLMQYCLERLLPHPGFVVLDSPLLAYWKPEGSTDSLVGTDLKERFFEYLCASDFRGQAIIVENEHPPLSLPNLKQIDFTRNPRQGRFGLFPNSQARRRR